MAQTALMIGKSTTILQGRSYALPAKKVSVSANLAVEVSIDGAAWNALTNANTVGADTSMVFIRCPSGNALVICKSAEKISSGGSGSGGSSLPTAPLGQVLISQGDGVPPIFSANPVVNQLQSGTSKFSDYQIFCAQGNIETNYGIGLGMKTVAGQGIGDIVGRITNFTDCNTKTPGAVAAAGGAFNVLVRWNGTQWIVIGG